MTPVVLAGTAAGLLTIDPSTGVVVDRRLEGHDVVALDGDWAVVDRRSLHHVGGEAGGPSAPVEADGARLHCVLAEGVDHPLVGASEAALLRLDAPDGPLRPVPSFAAMPGRDAWYTPWGAPADVRSLAALDDGTLLVNVHVGGIARSVDGGESWSPTLDIDADVHQVLAVPSSPRTAVAAAAVGLCVSRDSGATWAIASSGMHAAYCRAVAVVGDTVLVSASDGPGGSSSALYRVDLGAALDTPLSRVTDGLPRSLGGNVDTFCLAGSADGGLAVCAAPGGTLFASDDEGRSWSAMATGLPDVRCVRVGG